MSNLEIHAVSSDDDSKGVLTKFEALDIYYHPKYLQLANIAGDGKPFLAYYEDEKGSVVYPFMKKEMPSFLFSEFENKHYDIFSPYGYSGPQVANGEESDVQKLIHDFYTRFNDFCNDNRIVSEFIRFHPLLENHQFYPIKEYVSRNNPVVYTDLELDKAQLQDEMGKSTQRNIKKAERNDLSFVIDEELDHLERFKELYIETMDRVNAEDYYYFNDQYFQFLKEELTDYSFLGLIKKENGEVIASSLFFGFDEFVQYHLGASDKDFLDLRPNDLLFYRVALWAKNQGFSKLHLGGGHSSSKDSLFRFKASFSENTSAFYTGKVIHDKDKYEQLQNIWKQEKNKSEQEIRQNDYFPIYRS